VGTCLFTTNRLGSPWLQGGNNSQLPHVLKLQGFGLPQEAEGTPSDVKQPAGTLSGRQVAAAAGSGGVTAVSSAAPSVNDTAHQAVASPFAKVQSDLDVAPAGKPPRSPCALPDFCSMAANNEEDRLEAVRRMIQTPPGGRFAPITS
jgi:hypothetical protein